MNRSHTPIITALLVSAAHGVLAPVQADTKKVRRELTAIYARFIAANKARDGMALQRVREAVTDPGFLLMRPGQPPVARQEWVDEPRQGPWTPAREISLTLTRLSIQGQTAMVQVNSCWVGEVRDPQSTGDPSGRVHRMSDSGTFQDTWMRTREGWRLSRREWLRRSYTGDGRPFTPSTVSRTRAAVTASTASTPPDLSTLAERLVTQSAQIKEGDLVVISGGVRDARLLEDLAIAVRKRGAHPLIQLDSERNLRRSYTEVPPRYDTQAPEWGLKLGTLMDAMFSIEFAEAEDSLADVPPERVAAVQKAGELGFRLLLNRNVQSVHLGNGLYPTATRARLFGISQDELARIFWAGVNVDYRRLQSTGEAVKKRLTAGREVEITAPNGTHLRMRIEGRPVTVSDGVISPEDRQRGGSSLLVWLPAGEVYLVPVPGTAQGKVVVDRYVYQGKEILGLTVAVKDGRLTGMTARSGLERLRKEYEAAGPGKEQLSSLDFGINPNIPLSPGSRLAAYVPAGMVTVGFGGDLWAGGDNSVPFGFALFLPGTTVKVDGRVLVENGVLRP